MWFRPRSIFFLSFASLVTQVRFTSLLFRDFGLDDQKIGLALSVGLFAGAVMVPFWSRMADIQGSRYVLKIIMIGHLAATLLYSFTPLVQESDRVWFTLFGRILAMGFMQALSPVADAYALRRLGGSRAMYGKERSWGSFSWGLAAVIVGALMTVMNWTLAYELFTFVMTMLTLLILQYSPNDLTPVSENAYSGKVEDASGKTEVEEQTFVIDEDDKEMQAMTPEGKEKGAITMDPKVVTAIDDEVSTRENEQIKEKPKVGIMIFLRNAELTTIIFLVVMLCLEMGQSLTESLEFLFIVEELKSSPFLCGISVAVAVVLEVPLLFVSEPLLRRVGILLLMLSGIFVFIVKITAFTYMTSKNPWVILSVEPLGGIYVAVIKMSSVSFMSQAAPKGMEAVAMGTMNIFRCMGQVFGTLIGSYVLHNFGPTILYRSFGILVILAGFVLVWIFYYKQKIAALTGIVQEPSRPLEGPKTFREAGDEGGASRPNLVDSASSSGKRRPDQATNDQDVIKSEVALLELHKTGVSTV